MPLLSVFLLFLLADSASVPAGTRVEARLQSPVHTGTSKLGDAVVAVMSDPIRSSSRIVVPKGSRLNGRVETIEAATPTNEGRVRLVFREFVFPDGRRASTWITNSFAAPPPKRNRRYLIYMAAGGSFGAWIGGKSARIAGVLGGTLVGFIIAGNSSSAKLRDVSLRPGAALHLELGEDLTLQ